MPRRERRSFTPEFKARTVELIESGGPGSRGRGVDHHQRTRSRIAPGPTRRVPLNSTRTALGGSPHVRALYQGAYINPPYGPRHRHSRSVPKSRITSVPPSAEQLRL